MLRALSIRDIVLIDRLDLAFGPGLTVLTGETGAGKSILLDSLGLALGGRADAGLVRAGAAQASVTAAFAPGARTSALLAASGLPEEETLILRRSLGVDGRSRGWVNDTPVPAATLRRFGEALVERQDQHEQVGLANESLHATLLDRFGVAPALREAVRASFAAASQAEAALAAHVEAMAASRREEDYLRHAASELETLAPAPGEEERLAASRQALQAAERRSEAVGEALAELLPQDRRRAGPGAALRGAMRALERIGGADAASGLAAVMASLETAADAIAEAEAELGRLAREHGDARALERAEERLFALRAAARKHAVAVADLPDLLETFRSRLAALESGEAECAALARARDAAVAQFERDCAALGTARRDAASRLEGAIAAELPGLRLDKARFLVELATRPREAWGPGGAESVRFLIAANPGQTPGPLARVASGGELSRLMLALRVVLSDASPVPTLVFDEIDSGVGGATAAAVGERLGRLAASVQVLAVTHSPQVAARADAHLRIAKRLGRGQALTTVETLDDAAKREEIARMLAGERVTDAARQAAASLLAAGRPSAGTRRGASGGQRALPSALPPGRAALDPHQ